MSWTHLRDTKPTAKIRHACYLCGEPIRIGEQYVYRVGSDGDGVIVMKMHVECEKATYEWDDMDWECFESGDMERPAPLSSGLSPSENE